MLMTRSLVRTILVVLSIATLYMSLAPEASAQATCSLATIAGSWAATLTGTILFPAPPGPVPAAAVVRFNVDAMGTVSVNPNCTGTTTVNFFQSGALVRTSVLAIVFDNLSTHVRMVQKSLTLP